jgi:predicted RNase H-like HicB family nuclease
MGMQPLNTALNGPWQNWVVVQPEPSGQFTAQVVGLPELRAAAATREEAIQQVRTLLSEWVASGRLVSIEVPRDNPLLRFDGHLNPEDPLEQEFLDELARLRREDLERTLREYDQECSDSSSTPTT